jgi:hypothetical protein
MRQLKEIALHPYAPAYGAQVAPDAEGAPGPSVLPAATRQFVAWASAYWQEVSPDDFEFDGMKARHLETGTVYRIRVGMPIGGEAESGISVFCIRDGRLVLLADKPDRVANEVVHGTFDDVARKVTYVGPPAEGQVVL